MSSRGLLVITNPYQRYAEANLISASPLQLVVMLYECAYENVNAAVKFNRAADHAGRARGVNKALDVLMELTSSCDEGVAITAQLRGLYAYMQGRLMEAHIEQSEEKLLEVAELLRTMLDAWRKIAADAAESAYSAGSRVVPRVVPSASFLEPEAVAVAYGRF
jgi:flagellar secretion chaperone FliS